MSPSTANMPSLVVAAGPNGGGKSTFTRSRTFPDTEIMEPDAIALETRIRAADHVEITGAREALRGQRAAISSELESVERIGACVSMTTVFQTERFELRLPFVSKGHASGPQLVPNRNAIAGHRA